MPSDRTLDEIAREKGIRIVDAPATALSPAEEKRVMDMTPAEQSDYRIAERERRFTDCRPSLREEVTTGAEFWDGGRSPNPDQIERQTGGQYMYSLDAEGEWDGKIQEVATGRRITMEQLKWRIDQERALGLEVS